MANENYEQQGFNISETFSKTETFVENNKKNLTIVLGGLAIIVGGYFAYKTLILGPQEKEAQGQMFAAQRYFEQDSLKKAINGDGNYMGFKAIVDEFGFTPSANLAHYYLGLALLKQGSYQEAIDALEDYTAKDDLTGPLAKGAIGDAYSEMGKTDDAINSYLKAAKLDDNKFTTPVFLMKAGIAYESEGKYSESLDIYKRLKKDYYDTDAGRDADKYIARAEGFLNK